MVKIKATFTSGGMSKTVIYDIPLEDYDITNMRICMLIEDMEEFWNCEEKQKDG